MKRHAICDIGGSDGVVGGASGNEATEEGLGGSLKTASAEIEGI
jgi:hypothetical protein